MALGVCQGPFCCFQRDTYTRLAKLASFSSIYTVLATREIWTDRHRAGVVLAANL